MADRFFKKMKGRRRPLGRLAVGSAFFSFVYIVTQYAKIPLCPVRRFFQIQCLGCGLSRGFLEIMRGNFIQSFNCHIMSLPLFFCLLIYYSSCVVDVCLGTSLNAEIEAVLSKKYMYCFCAAVFTLLIVWNYNRNVL